MKLIILKVKLKKCKLQNKSNLTISNQRYIMFEALGNDVIFEKADNFEAFMEKERV